MSQHHFDPPLNPKGSLMSRERERERKETGSSQEMNSLHFNGFKKWRGDESRTGKKKKE